MVALLAFFGATSRPLLAQNARGVAQSSVPSVALLVMEDRNGQPLSLGSGFVVRDGVIATNLHVIEGAISGYVKFAGQKAKHEVSGIVGLDRVHDLVLLSVKGAQAPSIPFGDSSAQVLGDEVFVVGNPYGLEGTFSQGIISGIRKLGPDSMFQITAPISPGSSGGPVLNSKGEAIGVAVGTFRAGQNLNFAVPISYLERLLVALTPLTPLSTAKKVSPAISPFDDVGESNVTGVVGDQFAWGVQLVQGPVLLLSRIDFTFSLRNQLRTPVRKVKFVVVFYDKLGKPLDVYDSEEHLVEQVDIDVIQPGLAKRLKGSVDISVRQLAARTEIRVLSFDIVE